MLIGIDFDNTIVCYDGVFHAAALDRGLITPDIGRDKNAVRDHLNGSGQKNAFTELQGYVYGSRMDLAKVFDGVANFIKSAKVEEHELFIISHKTRYPVLGPQYDLHEVARDFLATQGLSGDGESAIPHDNIFFQPTKEEKIKRAASIGVDVFIDDLPEILSMPGLDKNVKKFLFDPNGAHQAETRYTRVANWAELSAKLLENGAT